MSDVRVADESGLECGGSRKADLQDERDGPEQCRFWVTPPAARPAPRTNMSTSSRRPSREGYNEKVDKSFGGHFLARQNPAIVVQATGRKQRPVSLRRRPFGPVLRVQYERQPVIRPEFQILPRMPLNDGSAQGNASSPRVCQSPLAQSGQLPSAMPDRIGEAEVLIGLILRAQAGRRSGCSRISSAILAGGSHGSYRRGRPGNIGRASSNRDLFRAARCRSRNQSRSGRSSASSRPSQAPEPEPHQRHLAGANGGRHPFAAYGRATSSARV